MRLSEACQPHNLNSRRNSLKKIRKKILLSREAHHARRQFLPRRNQRGLSGFAWPISLIAETTAQLKHASLFTKIDIRQAFHKLRMAAESDDLTTFISRYGAFK